MTRPIGLDVTDYVLARASRLPRLRLSRCLQMGVSREMGIFAQHPATKQPDFASVLWLLANRQRQAERMTRAAADHQLKLPWFHGQAHRFIQILQLLWPHGKGDVAALARL